MRPYSPAPRRSRSFSPGKCAKHSAAERVSRAVTSVLRILDNVDHISSHNTRQRYWWWPHPSRGPNRVGPGMPAKRAPGKAQPLTYKRTGAFLAASPSSVIRYASSLPAPWLSIQRLSMRRSTVMRPAGNSKALTQPRSRSCCISCLSRWVGTTDMEQANQASSRRMRKSRFRTFQTNA
jgi:hypothetical protein